jgi:hypothetical protein
MFVDGVATAVFTDCTDRAPGGPGGNPNPGGPAPNPGKTDVECTYLPPPNTGGDGPEDEGNPLEQHGGDEPIRIREPDCGDPGCCGKYQCAPCSESETDSGDLCGNGTIDDGEECESNDECPTGESCVACSCTDCIRVNKEYSAFQNEWINKFKTNIKNFTEECGKKAPGWLKRGPTARKRASTMIAGVPVCFEMIIIDPP